MQHMHLDPLGGAAGDMFVAALLHAFPEHEPAVVAAAQMVAGVPCRTARHQDGVLAGLRFQVDDQPAAHAHPHDHHHDHTDWSAIRTRIAASTLPTPVQRHALGIFTHLAEAEAQVHGIHVDAVRFHEVGAADSIADIVAAACLIDAIGPTSWSVGPLPLGSGRVRTAHGWMPVPAPATALLLQGLDTLDDGIPGERVTPTAAAILRHLGCTPRPRMPGRLSRTGLGFGTRTLPGLANVLRVLAFQADIRPEEPAHRDLSVIAFEVDDQSAEDLAAGLDRLRALPGVHDVLQMPAFGKKGRLATHIQLLARPDAQDAAIDACFTETTTIGLRLHTVQGRALPRQLKDVTVGDATLRVKLAHRPGNVTTAKAESDDVLAHPGHAARAQLRRQAETQALTQAEAEPRDDA